MDARLKETNKTTREIKLKKQREKADKKETIRQKIKDLAYVYRKRENSANILQKTKIRIVNIENDLAQKKRSQLKPFEILLMIDCLEILFETFQKAGLVKYKAKIDEFDRKMQDNHYKNMDSNHFLAKMFVFQQKYPDFQERIGLVIKRYREMQVEHETFFNRFQDLALQVFFKKIHFNLKRKELFHNN